MNCLSFSLVYIFVVRVAIFLLFFAFEKKERYNTKKDINHMKKKNKLVVLLTGLGMMLFSLVVCILATNQTFGGRNIAFDSTYKERKVTLKATYYEKKDAEYALLLCPGYSCDRAKWRVMMNVALSSNVSVMTFDYSGQGGSYGKIGFDNAKTDDIPTQIDDALETLHSLSEIEYENIILMGHSMGGRSILRLMYDYHVEGADTKLEKKNVKNIILFSPEVNYKHNAQASLFASTDDENEYPWKDYSSKAVEDVDVYLLGSTADDVVSSYDILRISERLTGKKTVEEGCIDFVTTTEKGNKVTVGVTSLVLHSYQMYSTRFADYLVSSLKSITGKEISYPTGIVSCIYLGWIFALVGIFLSLFALSMNDEKQEIDFVEEVEIVNTKSFLLNKLLLWIPGLLIGGLICCICVVLPFGSPVMNIPYMCLIAGYGILLFFLYRIGKVKGTKGKMSRISFKAKANRKEIILALLIPGAFSFYVWFILKMTMYNLLPFNIRLFWLVFSTLLMSIGYYVSSYEEDLLRKANAKKSTLFFYNLIQYSALFLFVFFYLAIKSYSGFIGQMQNLLLMYALTLPLGNYVKRKIHSRLYGALVSSFLFQAIMITSAAIISVF